MLLPSFVSSANFISTCWRSEPRLWEKILSKISLGNSPVALLLRLFSPLPGALYLLSQGFAHLNLFLLQINLYLALQPFWNPERKGLSQIWYLENQISDLTRIIYPVVNLSCLLRHPPPCLQLCVCFPPLKYMQRTCLQEDGSSRLTARREDGEWLGVSFPLPAWLCSGLWLWSRSCAATAFPTEVHPAAASIAFSLSCTKDFSPSCLIIRLHPWLDGHTRNKYQNTQNHSLSDACMKLCFAGACNAATSRTIFPSLLRVF